MQTEFNAASVALDWLRTDPILTVTQWADEHRILSNKASAEPGKYRSERTPYLKEIMDLLSVTNTTREIVLKKAAQIGAALPLDTLIPTDRGWATMHTLKVDDVIFDRFGKKTKVKWKSKVFHNHECYKITFSDHTYQVCDADHRWLVKNHNSRKKELIVKTTKELKESVMIRHSTTSHWSIPVCEPVQYSHKKKLIIDPYILGYWLGNGHRSQNSVFSDVKDQKAICKIFNDKSIKTTESNDRNCSCIRLHTGSFTTKLKALNVFKNKHIPDCYLQAPQKQRLELIRGLMDSDGSTSNNRCEFSTRSKALFIGFKELASSLGLKFSVYSRQEDRAYTKDSGIMTTTYRVSFATDLRMFRLRRKDKKQGEIKRKSETRRRFIKSIRRVKTVKTQCIEVESDNHTYLCGKDFFVTHNTEAGNNWIGYCIDHSPAPMMIIQPTVELAKRNSKQRIDPLIEESPRLRLKVKSKRARDSGNTILVKEFPGGNLVMTGANSAVGLRSMPARFLFFDETDAYPSDADGEGSPIELAKARSRTFSKRKAFYVSTPVIDGRSAIDDLFESSDKRYYLVPCPFCNEFQKLEFKQLKYKDKDPLTARYECIKCEKKIENWQKTQMLKNGKWVAEGKSTIAGFHLNALYSPVGWLSWSDIIELWLLAQGKENLLKSFTNTVLGETWKEKGEAPEWRRLYERREKYKIGTVPKGVCFLTCGVDVQKDRLEAEVVGWGRDKESWSIDYRIIRGDSSDEETWKDLAKLLGETFTGEGGVQIPIRLMAVDSGYNTQMVYGWVRQFPMNRVIAIKGQSKLSVIISHPKAVDVTVKGKVRRHGMKAWPVGVDLIKQETYGFLRQVKPIESEATPYGWCHFPEYDEVYFQQLTAEELKVKIVKGFKVHFWELVRDRNEVLDCRVYNRAAAAVLGIDRFEDRHFDKFESELGLALPTKNVETQPITRTRRKSEWL